MSTLQFILVTTYSVVHSFDFRDVFIYYFKMIYLFIFFFFFSSRRRHTRLTCDWSSDVCSSDLARQTPASFVRVAGRRAIFPREPNGGTWITANDAGVCLALINWHKVEREPVEKIVSRGRIVSELAGKADSADIGNGLTSLRLKEIRPFRLIAIVPKEKAVTEWRWNLELLAECKH